MANKATDYREMITLPKLNSTADKIFNRVIPAPNGDCKLIIFPGDQYFEFYNVTTTGLASAIACGVTNSTTLDGVAQELQNNTTDPGSLSFAPAPPKVPFKSLDPSGYVCLAHKTDPPFCLPPGSYAKQSGLGFEIKDVDILTLPPGGWALNTTYEDAPEEHQAQDKTTTATFTGNQTSTINSDTYKIFLSTMQTLDTNRDNKAVFTITGPTDCPDPVCCLFSAPNFGENVWCMVVGGDDVLPW